MNLVMSKLFFPLHQSLDLTSGLVGVGQTFVLVEEK